jgi:formate hydrogenlyase subunit 3/multisubunit Na+/H+ antiporter MnhD subunit
MSARKVHIFAFGFFCNLSLSLYRSSFFREEEEEEEEEEDAFVFACFFLLTLPALTLFSLSLFVFVPPLSEKTRANKQTKRNETRTENAVKTHHLGRFRGR